MEVVKKNATNLRESSLALIPGISFDIKARRLRYVTNYVTKRRELSLSLALTIACDEKAAKALDDAGRALLAELTPHLQNDSWSRDALEAAATAVTDAHGIGLGKLAGPLRAALAGRTATPSVFDMMVVLGRVETLARIEDAATQ